MLGNSDLISVGVGIAPSALLQKYLYVAANQLFNWSLLSLHFTILTYYSYPRFLECFIIGLFLHVESELVVAPDFFIRNQIELLKTLVALCEGHMVIILCPVPRYVTFRCCDDPNHCTNYDDPSYLATLLLDLARIRESLTKGIPSAVTLDTLEVLIG
jgi:hypothetical protein